MQASISTTLFMGDYLGDVDCVIAYDYSPAQRGRYSGPPEDCYPDEPAEVDITDVVLQGMLLSPERLSALIGELNEDQDLKAGIIEAEEEKDSERGDYDE